VATVVEDEDEVEALLEADGAMLDFAPAEIEAETPKERSIPGTRFSAAGFRVSLSRDNCTRTHSGTGSGGEGGQDRSDEQSGTHLAYDSTMERRMRWIVT
jgi:hypothetical protein